MSKSNIDVAQQQAQDYIENYNKNNLEYLYGLFAENVKKELKYEQYKNLSLEINKMFGTCLGYDFNAPGAEMRVNKNILGQVKSINYVFPAKFQNHKKANVNMTLVKEDKTYKVYGVRFNYFID